ncbi:PREDICTED: CRM-domain containing factor CFM3, chloroplastic/mitochondrial-like isoform X3 [Camelina sativa]|uniref:CRM-domain containing factor CFM3, chloroplastic/mitochondrial-like isoform X2 n=1 Tax=Camelina sativa TaxID=90675 RepID=A0ABM1RDC5_CAMSA|nr:PREDICTED: CRM-domain containing factor CFM3, chloroplastic/mitochondrial-like isoform X2 [Camelina sativa]XP_019097013.1 PREDICTED: CRM-domain containing factor CFM3, chloroplastic/mitochondrial-like isoform X3 [Camelina sativa]
MALVPLNFTEMPLRSSLPLTSTSRYCSSPSLHALLFYSLGVKPSRHQIVRPFSSLRTSERSNNNRSHNNRRLDNRNHKPSPPWIDKWPPSSSEARGDHVGEKHGGAKIRSAEEEAEAKLRYLERGKGQNAIDRIVLRLRNLGLGSDDEEDVEDDEGGGINGGDVKPVTGEERLGDLLKREWVRPDMMLAEGEESEEEDEVLLPWEKNEEEQAAERVEGEGVVAVMAKRRARAPSLAELTVEDSELRRLRRDGMYLRVRINIPKAGLTQAVMEKIHDTWRKEELVRLKFHEVLARDMKTAHEIVERRTGGMVIWRAGSVMVVYRGLDYQGPSVVSDRVAGPKETLFVPDVSSAGDEATNAKDNQNPPLEIRDPIIKNPIRKENMTEEEIEFNNLLDSLGTRFQEWWGTGVLPVDADLLPPTIPGYKTPFRLLPTGMRSNLTNAEMTNLRKIGKTLPCHFALGRNRNHQGLAAAILQIWEKSLIAKIAVKRGIQNTNNKLMADELKALTGGVLLLRNKYYIVIYRGKDFLPSSVAATLAERQELTKEIQDVEERVRTRDIEAVQPVGDKVPAEAGTLAEFYEAQARWGKEVTPDHREKMIEEASRVANTRVVKRIQHKLNLAQSKFQRAEKLLSKIEASMIPNGPDYDQEVISEEERAMFRKVGLKMKAYLPLGIRGVFDGVIENMHLHWKHRELVKLISKQKVLAFVEDTARLLEYESGGVLVAIEKVPKGFALIYYRGKNYRRPISLRPRNLLTKAKALKRSIAMQRHEALSQHISELERTIELMQSELTAKNPSYNESEWENDEDDDDDDEDEKDDVEDNESDWDESDGVEEADNSSR